MPDYGSGIAPRRADLLFYAVAGLEAIARAPGGAGSFVREWSNFQREEKA